MFTFCQLLKKTLFRLNRDLQFVPAAQLIVAAMGAVKTFTLKMKLAKKIKQNRWKMVEKRTVSNGLDMFIMV